MKKTLLAIALLATVATAAPAPYPITINSRNQTAPNVVVYQGNEMSFRASFTDGSTASDITGATPFMNWATNSLASGMSTSSWQVVGATTGLVDFTFSPQALNFTPGRYMYEVGLINDDVPSVYRQGVFQINGSPQGSGAAAVVFVDDVDWSLIGNYYNTSTDGPYLFGSGFTYTTNATGQLLLTAAITETQDLQAVTENGGTTTEQVTIDVANAHTNTYGGYLAVLGGRVQSGDFSTASGESSHAQGSYVTASGTASHAEGSGATASGIASHAEGTSTTASGNDAHAEGTSSTASGNRSHAEGSFTTASAYASHAAGDSANATNDNTFVWADGTSTGSTATKQFTVHADNGIRLLGAAGVEVEATVTAAAFVGVTADAVTYTNDVSGLAAEDVQAAIDELASVPQFSGLKRRLDSGYSCDISVGGDSTGVGSPRWVYLLAESLGASYTNYNIDYWETGSVSTPAWSKTQVQTGPLGESYFDFDGTIQETLRSPYTATESATIVGEIEVEPTTVGFTNATEMVMMSRYGLSGSRCWVFKTSTVGKILITVSTNGVANSTVFNGIGLEDYKVAGHVWLKFEYVPDNGANQNVCTVWYKTTEAASYTLLEAQTNAVARPVFIDDQDYEVGAQQGGAALNFNGKIYAAMLYDGDGGKRLLPPIHKMTRHPSTFYDSASLEGSPTLTIWNAAVSGIATSAIADYVDAWSFLGSDLDIMSTGYNDEFAMDIGQDVYSVNSFIRSNSVSTPFAVTLQPPSISPIPDILIEARDIRRTSQREVATANGFGLVDIQKAFTNDGRALGDLIDPDGTHPNADGMAVWAAWVNMLIDNANR